MLKIYLGGDVSEFHFDSGKVIVLTLQEEEELLGYNALNPINTKDKSESYGNCIKSLSIMDSERITEEFISDVKDTLYKEGE